MAIITDQCYGFVMKHQRIVLLGIGTALALMAFGCQSPTNTDTPTGTSMGKRSADCLVYTDLNEALRSPDSVCELNITGQGIGGALPSQIGKLRNLKVLNASNNKMTGLPAELGQLSQLEVLDVSNNQLTGLPMELGNLKQLREFNLKGNAYSEQDLAGIAAKLPQAQIVTK